MSAAVANQATAGEVVALHSLAENEDTISKGLVSFMDVGRALMEVRDGRQFHEAGFDTFEEYCQRRWDLSQSRAYQVIRSHQIGEICTIAELSPPESEWVARPLTKLLSEHGEDAVAETWGKIVSEHEGAGPVTGREVRNFLGGANYGNKPGWHEMIGVVGDALDKASHELAKFEAAIGDDPKSTREKVATYASLAEDIAARLRKVAS
jgi:hypothetical protein